MTLREYLEGRRESMKQFCARKGIDPERGKRYFYRLGYDVYAPDLIKIQAETNGLVDVSGITRGDRRERIVYIGRGRPLKNTAKKTIREETGNKKKKTGKTA